MANGLSCRSAAPGPTGALFQGLKKHPRGLNSIEYVFLAYKYISSTTVYTSEGVQAHQGRKLALSHAPTSQGNIAHFHSRCLQNATGV